MTKKESIIKKQLREESYFNRFCQLKGLKSYKFTALEERYDAKLKSGDTYFLAEIKVRPEYNFDFFQLQGSMLEETKLRGMWAQKLDIEASKGIKLRMLYFTFSNSGLLIYELSDPDDYEFTTKRLPIDNFDTSRMVYKAVHNLFNPIEVIRY
jgi:hypothetical protein